MEVTKKINYRSLALATHPDAQCAHCGFGVKDVLEVAHLDQNRANNDIDNLAILCPNCHKMHDLDLIPTNVIRLMRDHDKKTNWKSRMKDAALKAAATRKENSAKKKRSEIAKKAVATRKAIGALTPKIAPNKS
jgi:5-methylcytosine-specific restriction endonuclease McrA